MHLAIESKHTHTGCIYIAAGSKEVNELARGGKSKNNEREGEPCDNGSRIYITIYTCRYRGAVHIEGWRKYIPMR